MKGLIWLNGIASALFVLFAVAAGIVHWVIVPQLGYLQPPPAQVGLVIEQTTDLEGLRGVAMTLFDHVTDQTINFNRLIGQGVFWVIVHFSVAFLVAVGNLVLLRSLRRQPVKPGGR
jgi:hypothetical protein